MLLSNINEKLPLLLYIRLYIRVNDYSFKKETIIQVNPDAFVIADRIHILKEVTLELNL